MAPDFLVTIDTEADNEWDLDASRSYVNIQSLPRFQDLCDCYDIRPTYLVTFDVVQDDAGRETLQQMASGGNCEIGAHLHAWSTPPEYELEPGLFRQHPYLHEYPVSIQEQKLDELTASLTRAFQQQPRSYRGGRWSFDGFAAAMLVEAGYIVDTTVTPGVNWQANPGYSPGSGGSNFVGAPPAPYQPNAFNVVRRGEVDLLEVPVSILYHGPLRALAGKEVGEYGGLAPVAALCRRALSKAGLCRAVWLRPGFSSASELTAICDELVCAGQPVLNLMFHSSELIAGGSPRVRTPLAAKTIWESLQRVFEHLTTRWQANCCTLTEFSASWLQANRRFEYAR